ncbi:phosphoglycerate mutase-like protein [Hygrophoropsis aurantiaca]|uniref:Phosphoglycerate mutase-like protein n=1 Tax=Hygrophoropsis aurantiaca TaxID=72124 RepID=A0ACB8A0R2_9AGAM|nr:phosphoglycerate mutase-like protein [Hygrophoropsis aurantiaca]
MYLPALLRLLPIVTLGVLPVPYQDELEPPTGNADTTASSPLRLGNLTPYKQAPPVEGVAAYLPDDCAVDQVMLLHRHGSRGPGHELSLIQGLAQKIGNASEVIANLTLPENLQFLKQGYVTTLQAAKLTSVGRRQLFEHGVDFLFRYPHLHAETFVAGNEDRVIESSHWFGEGYLGLNASKATFITLPDTGNNWIRPTNGCPAWNDNYKHATEQGDIWGKKYIPSITQRLSVLLPGVNLSDDDTLGALYACAYDLAAYNSSPWCNVFLPTEFTSFDYESDLVMDGAFGYTLKPSTFGPMLGSLYVNKLIERFQNNTGDAKPMYLEFGHDSTITFAMAAIGLAEDKPPLSPDAMNPSRKWRTSDQVPFAANMVWERFTCKKSFNGPQIRMVLNEQTFPLDTCAKTAEDKAYGTCSLANFVAANKFSTNIKYGDKFWKDTCHITGARDVLVKQSPF